MNDFVVTIGLIVLILLAFAGFLGHFVIHTYQYWKNKDKVTLQLAEHLNVDVNRISLTGYDSLNYVFTITDSQGVMTKHEIAKGRLENGNK